MEEIIIRKAERKDLGKVVENRYVVLRNLCSLPGDFEFGAAFRERTEDYFENGDQTTVIAEEKETGKIIGCATLAYLSMMPTVSHPTGKRAHLMNVYVDKDHRHRKIGTRMVRLLVEEAKGRDVTEISLDATDDGRKLYDTMGFFENRDAMCMSFKSEESGE